MATPPTSRADQLFPTSKYVWPNMPTTEEEAKHMTWIGLYKGRVAYMANEVSQGRRASYSDAVDVLPLVNRDFDNCIASGRTASRWLHFAAENVSGRSSNQYLDNEKITDVLRSTSDKLAAAGKAAAEKKSSSSSSAPVTPVVAAEAGTATSSGTYLQRLMADPLATIKETFSNPWVLSGTVVVVGGLLYWFVLREPEATPVRANKKKNHYGKRHIARELGEEVEVESEEEIEEEVVPKKRATKSNRRSLKNRRNGRK